VVSRKESFPTVRGKMVSGSAVRNPKRS